MKLSRSKILQEFIRFNRLTRNKLLVNKLLKELTLAHVSSRDCDNLGESTIECTMPYFKIFLKKFFFLQIPKDNIKFGGKPVNLYFFITLISFISAQSCKNENQAF